MFIWKPLMPNGKRSPHYSYKFTFNKRVVQKTTKQSNKEVAKQMGSAELTRLAQESVGLASSVREMSTPGTVNSIVDKLKDRFAIEGKLSRQNLSLIKRTKADFGCSVTSALTKDDLTRYVERRMAKGAALATCQRPVQLLLSAYRNAGLNPPPYKVARESDNTREGFFDAATFEKLVSHLPADLRDFVRFAYLVGWRKSSIAKLEWTAITDNVIYLRAKNAKDRKAHSLPIVGADLCAIFKRRELARAIKTREGTVLSKLVFHRGGLPVGDFKRSWKTACAAAGCEDRLFHDLRRTSIKNMLECGTPQTTAMKISQHATNSVFKRYAITEHDDISRAILAVSQLRNQKVAAIG